MSEVSAEFAQCWQVAGRHLQAQLQGSNQFWLKATLVPPFLEHLSFRLGNQLFFIRIEDAEGSLDVPGLRRGVGGSQRSEVHRLGGCHAVYGGARVSSPLQASVVVGELVES